jgi:transposase
VLALHAKGVSKQDIAAACDIGIASVYRILKAA